MTSSGGPTLEFRLEEESSFGTATPQDFQYYNTIDEDETLSMQGDESHDMLQTVEEEGPEVTVRRVQINEMDDSGRLTETAEGRRSVNTPRVPTQAVRAMLVRTPANKDGSDNTPRDPDEFRPAQTEPDILITELKDHPPELVEGDVDEGSDIEEEYKHVNIETVDAGSAEEDWDTDLELEEPSKKKKDAVMTEVRNHDPSGRSYYDKVCSRMGLVPVSYIKRHITDNEITMRYHGLGPSAAKAIALVLRCIKRHITDIEITMRYHGQGPSAAKAIALVLRDNITLEKLNLQGNWIEGQGGLAMARMLEENDYITELVLSDNKLGTVGATCMCKMLSVNAGLRKLDLSGNNFDDKDAPIFADALENAKYLKELYLAKNSFGSEAGEILGPAISSNDILEVLDLSWNHIRGKGAIAVAKGIGENVRLKVCNVSWNGFGHEGGAAMGEALTNNSSLVEVDVSGNRLNAESAIKIGRVIASNDNIRCIKIGNNILTTAGAIALASAINASESSELEELDLTDVPVEFEFLRIFEDIKLRKPDFKLTHGPVLSSGNTSEDLGKPAIHPYKRKEPVLILDQHIVVNDKRLLDILKTYDKGGDHMIQPEDFISAVEQLSVPFNKPKLQDAVNMLADTQGGKIYFGGFIEQQEEILRRQHGAGDDNNNDNDQLPENDTLTS